MSQKKKPQIIFTKYSPYMVCNMETVKDETGKSFAMSTVTSLCRCGKSQYKPYCDGTHASAGFIGEKADDRVPDLSREYIGKDITIYYNRGICAHDGACVNGLPTVFLKNAKNWIVPDGDSVGKIIETIEKCPSGALSYKIGKRRYQDYGGEPEILVKKKGPLQVKGQVDLMDDMGSKSASSDHFCLCRCGESKNKPFCDGAHSTSDFEE